MIVSNDYFSIDGIISHSVGLYVDTPPMPPMASREYTEYRDNTGNENHIFAEDYFKPVTISITAYIFDGGFEPERIYQYLHSGTKLKVSKTSKYYYKIKKVLGMYPDYSGLGKNKLQIQFECSPFRYNTDNEETELENGGFIVNHGSVVSRPVWKVYNIQDPVYLTVNGITVKLDFDAGQTVTIDTERMIAYSGNTIVLDKTSGQLPLLSSGDNLISWTGSCDRVTITKNERWL